MTVPRQPSIKVYSEEFCRVDFFNLSLIQHDYWTTIWHWWSETKMDERWFVWISFEIELAKMLDWTVELDEGCCFQFRDWFWIETESRVICVLDESFMLYRWTNVIDIDQKKKRTQYGTLGYSIAQAFLWWSSVWDPYELFPITEIRFKPRMWHSSYPVIFQFVEQGTMIDTVKSFWQVEKNT